MGSIIRLSFKVMHIHQYRSTATKELKPVGDLFLSYEEEAGT